MQRTALDFLAKWFKDKDRLPLVIRGARQVGKTWLVRHFAEREGLKNIEINFEKREVDVSFFDSNDPREILRNLSSLPNIGKIDPKKSILFLDEIQVFPELFAKLRWFAEDMPELPVIAAGSLLEFVLEKPSFSIPVGRIGYMYLEPLSFIEFLEAIGQAGLADYVKTFQWGLKIPQSIHERLMFHFHEYLIIGGMPRAVKKWIDTQSFQEVNEVHIFLFSSYRDDFNRYKGRLDIDRLDEVMLAVPKMLGEKFVYSNVNRSVQTSSLKKSLELLCLARVCSKVRGTAANGVPLGAEIQDNLMKVIFLDVGLCSVALDITLDKIIKVHEINLINSGGIAEQVVGQLLRTINPFYINSMLYYWQREKPGTAELDYVIQHKGRVIPIEVKAGKTGKLKSMHYFMGLKRFPTGVRFNSDFPSKNMVSIKDADGNNFQYELISLPFYLISELHRLLDNGS